MLYNNRYYNSNYSLEERIEQDEQIYDVKMLDDHINYAIDNIKDLQEAIKRCQQYLSFLYHHKQLAEDIGYTLKAYCQRYALNSGISYYTGIYKIPCVPNGDKYKVSIETNRWKGCERGAAIQAAKDLAKKYKCELEMKIDVRH